MFTQSSVLTPLGAHNASMPKSKGRKAIKRERSGEFVLPESCAQKCGEIKHEEPSAVVLLRKQLLIGFNQVTRHPERLSSLSGRQFGFPGSATEDKLVPELAHIAAVFLLRPLDELIFSHLPA